MTILPSGSPENHLLQAALGYARRGWRVMPLHEIIEGDCSCGKDCGNSKAKHPRTRHGLKDATVNEDAIRAWWDQWPSANVGLATGPESGFFMVGPDGQAGIDALAELERKHGALPLTPRLRSGGGGRHYYLAWPAEGGIKSGANYNGLPIDVRGLGGLVVAAPSLHASGNRYTWEVPPDGMELAQAPPWLLQWLRTGKGTTGKRKPRDERTNLTNQSSSPPAAETDSFNSFVRKEPPANGKVVFTVQPDLTQDVRARAVAYLESCPGAVSGQGGHNATLIAARSVVYGFDLGREVGYDLLAQHYNARCAPPWSETELRHKCEDADTKPFDKPRGYLLQADEQAEPAGDPGQVNGDSCEDIEALPMPPPAPWPTLPPEALYGLAGEVVRAVEPETESDPVAVLGQLLVASGNAIGRGPHFAIEGDAHHTNLFQCLVGESSRGRKGTSRGRVMQLMSYADDGWCQNCVASGLSSGEGMVWAVRDPIEKKEPIKEKGRVVGYQTVVADEGVSDSRNVPAASLLEALAKLRDRGDTYSERVKRGRPGAPAERWFARRTNEGNELTEAADSRATAGGRPTQFCILRDPQPDPDGGPDEPPAHTTSTTPEKPLEQEGCVRSVFCAPGPPSREPPGHEGEGQGGPSEGPGSQDTEHKTHTTPFPQGNEGGSGGCVREGGPPPLPPVPPGSPAERAEGPVDPPAPPNPQADREVGEL